MCKYVVLVVSSTMRWQCVVSSLLHSYLKYYSVSLNVSYMRSFVATAAPSLSYLSTIRK